MQVMFSLEHLQVEIITMVSLKDGLVCTGGRGVHLLSFLQHLPYLLPWQALSELVSVIPLFEIIKKWFVSFLF